MHDTTIALIVTGIVIPVSGFIITWIKDGRARKWIKEDREEAKRERERQAESTKAVAVKLAEHNVAVEAAHRDLRKDIAENTKVNVAALDAANNQNEKMVRLTETVAITAAVAAAAQPHQAVQKVEVVNTEHDPIPVQPVHEKP